MWKLNSVLRDKLLDCAAKVSNAITDNNTISFGDGDGSGGRDTINDSASGLGDFLVGDYITVIDSVSNDKTVQALSVTAGIIEVAAGSFATEAASAIDIILAASLGGSYRGIFRNCTIKIFTGAQPSSADDAETGSVLCQVTLSSGAFVAGSPGNGLNFGQVADAVLHKAADEIWSGLNSATGTAGWFRIYDNDLVTGADSTSAHMDGSCSTSGAQLNLTTTSLVSGVTTTIDQANIPMPAQ